MKIKCDFVTNSSSCSFIMAGWSVDLEKIKDDIKNEEYLLCKYLLSDDDETGAEVGRALIGIQIGSFDDGGYNEHYGELMSLSEIINNLELKEIQEKYDFGEIKLISGCSVC